MYKQVPHEESVRVPFFIRYPGVTPKGESSDTLFASIDIYPTLCGLAGIPVPAHCKGRDFSATMRGHSTPASEVVFLINQGPEHAHEEANAEGVAAKEAPGRRAGQAARKGPGPDGGGYAPPNYRGLRTRTHTYAVAEDGRWLLFDNVNDPYQQRNLINDPKQKELMAHFDGLIKVWLRDADDPFDYAAAVGRISVQPA